MYSTVFRHLSINHCFNNGIGRDCVKRQVNKCAHVLIKYVCFNISLYESFVIPSWLKKMFIFYLLSI